MDYKFLSSLIFFLVCFSQVTPARAEGPVTILDAQHYSHVFGEMRNYRIFLPPNYNTDGGKKYPVIYFLHGWSQRYFGSGPDAYSEYDQQDDNKGDNIEKFVSQHEVIIVKSDGYNRYKEEDYYLRPYNIGPVETHRQFPIYFEELINHIDGEFPTIADRAHRAITGLSMGGFMSFFIAAKYPHLFSAVGSFCGSPEFVIGPKEMPVEYRHIDVYRNYDGMNVRLHYGDQDFIRGYHADLNRIWRYTMDHYSFKIFPGEEHTTSGLGEMFDFLFTTFKNPPSKPFKWTHTDIYPEFKVWDYQVKSDRNVPGFTVLENVDERGFKISVREFLPDGPTMPFINMSVLTGPVYEKNKIYTISDYDVLGDVVNQKEVSSDDLGRIRINVNGGTHHIGINKISDKSNITIFRKIIEEANWATAQKDISLSIFLLNNGQTESGPLKVSLSSENEVVIFSQSKSSTESIGINQWKKCSSPFILQVKNSDVDKVQLKLEISDNKNTWTEYFELEIKSASEEIQNYQIADGGTFLVATGGDGIDTLTVGRGNADGVANPGESIEILVKDKGVFRRTLVTSDNPCINPRGMNIRYSDYWGRYDHVGGSAKYSILTIASECNSSVAIPLFLEYWLPDRPLHIIKKGTISLLVEGQDLTPPDVRWTTMTGKNLLQVKVNDGSPVKVVTGTFTAKEKTTFTVILNDEGRLADRTPSDGVFTAMCPPQLFGFYQLTLELQDAYGNKSAKEISEPFILHH